MRRLVLLALATAAVLGGCGDSQPERAGQEGPTVEVGAATLRGVDDGGTHRYLGIRFAGPPTDQRRFAAPVEPPPLEGMQDATQPGAQCPQPKRAVFVRRSPIVGEEDCLFLDVTVPADAETADKPLPVMVWLHGGAGVSGSGSIYDARRLAERGNVIVVTPNYRLGQLGLLAVPGLAGGGTFALADQIAALRWTQAHIAAFGGHPSRTTLFGQSQGGFAVCGLLTAPEARGLFQRASMASGNCSISFPANGFVPRTPATDTFISRKHADRAGLAAARRLGCLGTDPVPCLRRLPATKLAQEPTFSMAYGSGILPRDPEAALERGEAADVPVIVGTTTDEADTTIGVLAGDLTRRQAETQVREAFGAATARAVERRYPGDAVRRYARAMTDAAWACPTARTRELLAARGPTYAYEFADRSTPNEGVKAFEPGAGHASDVPYLFDLGGEPLLERPASRELADRMIDYWARFAHTGAPGWPSHATRQLRPGGDGPVDYEAEHRCAFWR